MTSFSMKNKMAELFATILAAECLQFSKSSQFFFFFRPFVFSNCERTCLDLIFSKATVHGGSFTSSDQPVAEYNTGVFWIAVLGPEL